MVVYGKHCGTYPIMQICNWDKECESFCYESEYFYYRFTECYYAYITYVPSGYETYHPIKCTCESCPQGYDDNGYCMDYDHEYTCGYKKEIAEYSIEEKRIWKEFE
jgi:hypothetical protein